MQNEYCFVIMGFGKKQDPVTGRQVDLDKSYRHIIKPAAEDCGLRPIRADEIQTSGSIDKSMYALLSVADFVIADITTLNPNAIYELGVRHALRPNSTIILKDDSQPIPFDINHNAILMYKHHGESLDADAIADCKDRLTHLIKSKKEKSEVDSPFYTLTGATPPEVNEAIKKEVLTWFESESNTLARIIEEARQKLNASDFYEAYELWSQAAKQSPSEIYFVQQQALALYKSKHPTPIRALMDAHALIQPFATDHIDSETQGIYGAICKNLYHESKSREFLEMAIEAYNKSYVISNHYYTGQNVVLCQIMLANITEDEKEKTALMYISQKTAEGIIASLVIDSNVQEGQSSLDDTQWRYATLAFLYKFTAIPELHSRFEKLFLGYADVADWEKDSYYQNLALIAS